MSPSHYLRRELPEQSKQGIVQPFVRAHLWLQQFQVQRSSTVYERSRLLANETPPDGKCLAQDTDTVKNLTNLAQVKGKWWILRGLNCGQLGWPAGFDYFPCQQDHFVFQNA